MGDDDPPPEEAQITKLPLDVAVADLRSLLQMLRSPEEHIKEYAVRALLGYAKTDAKCFVAVIKLGIGVAEGQVLLPRDETDPSQLTDEEELLWRVSTYGVVAFFCYFLEERNKLQIAALDILAYLTRDQGVRDNMRVLNCMPYVADAIAVTTEDVKIRDPSLEIVKNFAGELTPTTLTALRECVTCEGACNVVVPGVVDLMVNHPDLEERAMVALAFLCRDTETRFRLRELGGLKHLLLAISRAEIQQTDPNAPAVAVAATEVLVHAADDPVNKKELTRLNGVHRLLNLMEQTHSVPLGVNAAIVLDKMVKEVENRDALRNDASAALVTEGAPMAGLLRLMDVLGGKILTEVLRPGLSALAYCSFDSSSCEVLCEHGGVAAISRLLASGGGGKVTYGRPAKASAAMVLANMSRDPSLRLVVIRNAGVPAAIRALNDKEAPTQQEAAIALHRLALDVSGTALAQMKKAGVSKRLCELLTAGEEGPAYAAAAAIESYVKTDEESRQQIKDEGGLPGLAGLLRKGHDARTRCAAAGAVEYLALDADVRDALDHEGCTEHLAHMLDTDHLQMLVSAIAACKTMAVDEPIANNLCLHGGYTMLTKLEETSPFPRIRRGASEVVEQLLKINLAMKFYLQGRLSQDVKIKDGFFVQFGGSGFRTADELRKEPQDDQNIECLTLDSMRDPDYTDFSTTVEKAMAACKDSFQAQVKSLSKLVAERMGGPVNLRTVANLGYTTQIARIKADLGSHAVPIGKLSRGALRHRAFLFKALADLFGVPCSLERSEDGWRMWNCVTVKGEQRVLDLMSKPGEAYPTGSPEADAILSLEITKDPATNTQHGSLTGPTKRIGTILDDNLFPHSAISYNNAKPHFTAPSKLFTKTDGVTNIPGNAEMPFQPSAGMEKPRSLGGRGGEDIAFDYETKLAETVAVIKEAASQDKELLSEQHALLKASFDWICKNVRYAYSKGAGRHSGGNVDAPTVLQRRRGKSVGFSELLAALCGACGLEAEVIKGHCKIYDMQRGAYSKPLRVYVGDNQPPAEPEEPEPEPEPTLTPEHAWNLVKVDGRELLVDVCAMVYLGSESGEIQGFCGCEPSTFVLDHFPDEEGKQFMETPVSRENFIKTLHLRPGAAELGVKIMSHPGAQATPMVATRFRTAKPYMVVLRSPDDVVITAKLLEYGLQMPESLALVHRRGTESFVDVACASHGAYTLRIFAHKHGEEALPTWVCDYTLDVDAVDKQGRVGFVERLPPAIGKVAYVRTPQQMNLESSNAHVFDVEIPGATAVALGSSKVWLDLDAEFGEADDPWGVEGRFRGVVYVPHGGEFLLYVSINNEPYQPWMKYFAM